MAQGAVLRLRAINEPPPFKGLNIRISIRTPIKGILRLKA